MHCTRRTHAGAHEHGKRGILESDWRRMISRGWTDEDVARVENPAVKGVQPNESPKPKGRIPKPEMNSTERRYAQYLDLQKAVGEILWYGFETVTIKLGPDCRFTPDFLVMLSDGSLSFHDTKGSKAIKTGKRSGQTQPYVEEEDRKSVV